MAENFWDLLMGDDEGAANYMTSYGEGVGSETRFMVGNFINDGESVLDVGCGPGLNLTHFKEHGPKISGYRGLDYSERFVRVANQREGMVNKKFRLGDCRQLKEPDKAWDVVILQDVLEHTNGYEGPVQEALRVARRRVIVTFWHLTETDDHINDDGNDGYGAWYSRPKWEAFLDTLSYPWLHTELSPTANRAHDFFIIEKENV